MPTEFKPGKIDQTSSDSIVDVLTNSNLPTLRLEESIKPNLDSVPKLNKSSENKSESIKVVKKMSIIEIILSVFTSDILWFSVAIACLSATILFYFQVLQPLILREYIETAKAQVIESNQKFTNKFNQINATQQNIIAHLGIQATESCSEEARYDQSIKDLKDIEGLKNLLSVDATNKNLNKFYIFSDTEVSQIYNDFGGKYTDSLKQFQPILAQLKIAIDFADYKNIWVDNCINIKNSNGNTKELQAVCDDISIKSANYFKNSPTVLTTPLSANVENVKSLCQDVLFSKAQTYSGFGLFQLNWLNEFDSVYATKYAIDNTNISNIATDFQNSYNQTLLDLDKVYQSRNDFTKIWYLMDLETR
jgi:hypothetical protein